MLLDTFQRKCPKSHHLCTCKERKLQFCDRILFFFNTMWVFIYLINVLFYVLFTIWPMVRESPPQYRRVWWECFHTQCGTWVGPQSLVPWSLAPHAHISPSSLWWPRKVDKGDNKQPIFTLLYSSLNWHLIVDLPLPGCVIVFYAHIVPPSLQS